MPRPRKCRRICSLPENTLFVPAGADASRPAVVLTVDEYEAVRLIDKEGLSQEQCGEFMNIARTTVQQIYTNARRKIAESLVGGRPLEIHGGEYCLCPERESHCGRGWCRRRCSVENIGQEGKKTMKIAIPLDENKTDVCPVLSRAPYFLFREDEKETVAENPAAAAESGAGVEAAQFLVDSAVSVLITPRCGQNAADVFTAAGMQIYKSAHQTAADDLAAYREGKLEVLRHFHGGYHGIR